MELQRAAEEIIAQVIFSRCLKQNEGYCFSHDYYRKNGGLYDDQTIKARLGVGDWKSVMVVIGAKQKPRTVHVVVSAVSQRRKFLEGLSEAELFGEIDRVWQAKRRQPTYGEFRRDSKFGIRIYETRFGSWRKALLKAKGVRVQEHATKDMLLDELRAIKLKLQDDVITFNLYKENGGDYDIQVFKRRFGTWKNAVNAVGGVSGVLRYIRKTKFSTRSNECGNYSGGSRRRMRC